MYKKIVIQLFAPKSNWARTCDIMSLIVLLGSVGIWQPYATSGGKHDPWWMMGGPTPWSKHSDPLGNQTRSTEQSSFYTVEEVIFHGGTQVPLLKHGRGEPVNWTNCVFWVIDPWTNFYWGLNGSVSVAPFFLMNFQCQGLWPCSMLIVMTVWIWGKGT